MQLPTRNQLMELTAVENHALMLRVLMTSDLSWHYMLFKKETLRDIINVGMDLMEIEGEDALEVYYEIREYHQVLRDYIASSD